MQTFSPNRPTSGMFTACTPLRMICGLTLGLVLLNVPIFLCQHLTLDTVIYDLQARCALEGGVLYRDIVEPNLPGVVWVHMLVRQFGGWSDPILRLFDLVIVGSIIFVLSRFIRRETAAHASLRTAIIVLALLSFYLGLLEWCHCQRDLWMLLPCLLATRLRLARFSTETTSAGQFARFMQSPFCEGLLWAIAFWIKPHIAIPAICVIAASYSRGTDIRTATKDALGVLAGGLLVGGLGSLWLMKTGAWNHFWVMQLKWNPEYLEMGRSRMTLERLLGLWNIFLPWSWAHVVATIVALNTVRTWFHDKNSHCVQTQFLAILYLGWMIQVFLLQYPFMYVHVPGLFLAITLTCSLHVNAEFRSVAWMGAAAFGLLVGMTSPIVAPVRFFNWTECIASGPSMELRSRIQVDPQPNWQHLHAVVTYLQQQHVRDGEVTVYTNHLIQIYPALQIDPSTRFVFLDTLARLFKNRTAEIRQALESSSHRFAVSSLTEAGMAVTEIEGPTDPRTLLPESFPAAGFAMFPYTQPAVFRSGPYVVHRVENPIGHIATDFNPLAKMKPTLATHADHHEQSSRTTASQQVAQTVE